MSTAVHGWASHLSADVLAHELERIEAEREAEHRKLTRKARRTPKHVLARRRPSMARVTSQEYLDQFPDPTDVAEMQQC